MIRKIVSGGQTGVDRAALDVAMELDMDHGGWCPAGRLAEDGKIPDIYQLQETAERDYAVRTEKNVIDSDGTLIFSRGKLKGGTRLTRQLARKHHRPCLAIDLNCEVDFSSFRTWIEEHGIEILNLAGPRESSDREIYSDVRQLFASWLREINAI